jgi:hypothetical protein
MGICEVAPSIRNFLCAGNSEMTFDERLSGEMTLSVERLSVK